MNKQFSLIIYTDGGSRGNPGPAAYGYVIYDSDKNVLHEEGKAIGVNTNNVAEYSGIVESLKWVQENISKNQEEKIDIQFFMDSQLAAMQLSGLWKIKNENLRNLFFTIKILERNVGGKITFSHVRREQNKEADRLVNLALDSTADF